MKGAELFIIIIIIIITGEFIWLVDTVDITLFIIWHCPFQQMIV